MSHNVVRTQAAPPDKPSASQRDFHSAHSPQTGYSVFVPYTISRSRRRLLNLLKLLVSRTRFELVLPP